MKKIQSFIILLSLLGTISCAETTKKQSSSNLEEKIARVNQATIDLNNALINPQNANFENLVSEELTYGHSSGKIQNKKEFIDDLINGSFKFNQIENLDQTIDIIDQTAIVRNIFSAKATNNGESLEFKIGIILVYQFENNNLTLIARQAYKL